MKAGEVYENPVTGERVVIRVGAEECGGELLVADLYVKPDGASVGEHVHPGIEEGFTVVRGRLGYRLEGREGVAGPGQHLHVPHGTTHDWWNAGEKDCRRDQPRRKVRGDDQEPLGLSPGRQDRR